MVIIYMSSSSDSANEKGLYAYWKDNCTQAWNFTDVMGASGGLGDYDTVNDVLYFNNGTYTFALWSNGTEKWRTHNVDCFVPEDDIVTESVNSDDDCIYFTCHVNNDSLASVYALWKINGTQKWNYTDTGNGGEGAWKATPLIIGERLFVGQYTIDNSTGLDFYALWKDNGTLIWRSDIEDVLLTAVYNDGYAWIEEGLGIGDGGDVHKVNITSGSTSCFFDYYPTLPVETSFPHMETVPAISSNGLVYLASASAFIAADSWIFALYEENCSLAWSFKSGKSLWDTTNEFGTVYSTGAIGNGQYYIAVDDWLTYAFGDLRVNYTIPTPSLINGSNNYTVWVQDNLDIWHSSITHFTFNNNTGVEAPQYANSTASQNTTLGGWTLLSLLWSDDNDLDDYMFSIKNESGTGATYNVWNGSEQGQTAIYDIYCFKPYREFAYFDLSDLNGNSSANIVEARLYAYRDYVTGTPPNTVYAWFVDNASTWNESTTCSSWSTWSGSTRANQSYRASAWTGTTGWDYANITNIVKRMLNDGDLQFSIELGLTTEATGTSKGTYIDWRIGSTGTNKKHFQDRTEANKPYLWINYTIAGEEAPYVNQSWTDFSATTSGYSNGTFYLNDINGTEVCWKVYANDTADNLNVSEEYCFTITSAPSLRSRLLIIS